MGKNILLVDDEADIREIAQVSLEAVGGWTVQAVASGREALAAVDLYRPDAILLDVMMPDMDGASVFQQLQRQDATCDIPVILLTAKTQEVDRRRFEGLGVSGLLPKPFDPMSLADDVSAVLGWAR